MVTKMTATSFETFNDEKWKEVAEKSLRGLPFEKLITKTIEEIDLKPLYTKEQFEKDFRTNDQMLHSVRKGIESPDWTIAQCSYVVDGKTYVSELKESIERGNEAIVYDGSRKLTFKEAELQELANLIQLYPLYAFNVSEEDSFMKLFDQINEADRKNVKGVFTGKAILPEGFHLLRTSYANMIPLHQQGADIITELAVTLSIAAEKAEQYNSFVSFSNQFFVRFAIDTQFFLEIAKLRAFRVLWQTFAEAYGYTKFSKIPILSETSLRTYSKLDPYVNLLRAGNEAFSAVLGGTDVLTVHPHNILTNPTPASVRYARNIQLVIKEETFVQYVLDPSGGSYYIDTLTNQMIDKAWELFKTIEEQGGYSAYVANGELNKKLDQLYKQRMDQISRREKSLIGTNIYADLTTSFEKEEKIVHVERRLAEPYEKLREFFEHSQPKTVLLTFGKLKDFKARADFVLGYLATAGIKTEQSPPFSTVEEARDWMKQHNFDYAVICTPPKETKVIMDEFIQDFPNEKWIDIAGKFDAKQEAEWKKAGVSGFIYQGQNQLEKLTKLQTHWEEVKK
ncbi:methylmalonyl-CoA mutase family protein [Pseudogracilibacillus sp. SE30717A]|uniref:methylmalonyl-CoA mutase family protein n=1 Tax=Pseudogracilibacillus sp. SE30717A TaxID=3098293 RepID=UPI00300DC7A9